MTSLIKIISSDKKEFNVNEEDLINNSEYFKIALNSQLTRERIYNLDFLSSSINLFIQFINEDELNIGYIENISEIYELGDYLQADDFINEFDEDLSTEIDSMSYIITDLLRSKKLPLDNIYNLILASGNLNKLNNDLYGLYDLLDSDKKNDIIDNIMKDLKLI